MAISVTFNGATIYKPGAYSKLEIDLGGGFPLGPAGIVAIFGESERGRPGADEADISRNVYTADQMPEIKSRYGTGPVVDAANFLFSPAADAAIPAGAQAVYIYKTNASTQAKRTLKRGLGDFGDVLAEEYGLGGNRITMKVEHIKEVAPEITAADDVPAFGATIDGETLSVRLNGEAVQSVTIAGSPADIDALIAELNAGLSGVTVDKDTAGTKLVVTVDEDADAHQKGWGKSLSLSGDLASFGFDTATDWAVSTVESAAIMTATQRRDLISEEDTVGGMVVLKVGHTGAAPTATISIDNEKMTLKEGASTVLELKYSAYPTIQECADAISALTGWKAELETNLLGQFSPTILDEQTNLSVLSDDADRLTGRIKQDLQSVQDYFEEAMLTDIDLATGVKAGLPDETKNGSGDVIALALTGGEKGGTSTAEIVNALAAFEEIRANSVIPLFSRNATDDILDGMTDAGSNYTIDGIHQAVKTHCNFMSNTTQKSERQGYLSQKGAFVDMQTKAENLADARLQLLIQDIRQNDSEGRIRWFLPWALACLLAGARGGSPVGTPMTFKFLNLSGLRHTDQPLSTPEEEIVLDFNPRTQFNQAIRSGITFLENPPQGGFRVVVDNTTYGRDGNWVQNRASTRYAADILTFELRRQLEDIYVGSKNTVAASEVRSVCETIMASFLAQGITVRTDDAPQGFKELTVRIDGNIIYVSLVAKLVEGIDFVLAEIKVQRAQSAA